MQAKQSTIVIELFYTLTCPNCKVMKNLLNEVLPEFNGKFEVKQILANLPLGIYKTLKLNIHSVPAIVINNEVIFKKVPAKEELINKLKTYL
jgi:thiol-disulfide isomerase/thioredoxin